MKYESKFIVVMKNSFSFSSLGDFLNTFYRTDGEEIHFLFGTVPKDGFFVPHGVITKIKQMIPDWKERYEFYSQKGDNRIQKYSIPERKKSCEEKRVNVELQKIISKRARDSQL